MSNQEELTQQPIVIPGLPPVEQAMRGYYLSQAIYVAAKLGIADLVEDGPKTSEELARAAGANASSLYRVIRALACVGIFHQDERGRFAQTPYSTCLRTGVPGSLRALAIMHNEEHYRAWGDLLHSVKTGEAAFEHVFGMGWIPYQNQNPATAKAFHDALTANSSQMGVLTAAAYDFSGFKKIIDVGGGYGGLLTSILKPHPSIRGVLYDRAPIIAGAREQIDTAGLSERCELIVGDFFEAVPSGGDAYVMSRILHDWDDDRDLVILRNCHRAMAEKGKLLVVETVLPPGNEPSLAKFADLTMLVIRVGARERTEAEYGDLLAHAGFKLARVIPTAGLHSVLEAVPV
jgi:SAM-dependent methyltransferase